MTRASTMLSPVFLAVVLVGCQDAADNGSATSSTSVSSSTTTEGSATDGSAATSNGTGSGPATDGSGTQGADDSTGMFIGEIDQGGDAQCDIFDQDCPDGEKCMPWANDGGNSWNATKCTPVERNPGQPGDPCTVQGNGVSGLDDCAKGSMCYNVNATTNQGTCYELCKGDEAAPYCESVGTVCSVYNDGVLPLCLHSCDPLLADCPMGDLCLGSPEGTGFVCILDSLPNQDGGYGTPCEYVNVCDPGLFCATAQNVPGCAGNGCCSQFCDLTAADPPSACDGKAMGQQCLPWWGDAPTPPGYGHVGYCGIPN